MIVETNHVLYEKNGLIKRDKETIRFEQISSVSVRRGWFFANLVLETTGGTRPIVLNGLWAGEAEGARVTLSHRIEEQRASVEERVIDLMEEQADLLRQIASAIAGPEAP